jgi:F0F1-type ATP synthase assembly protein I
MTRVAWQCTIVGAVFGILVGSAIRNDPFFDHSYLLFIGLVGLLIGYFVGKYVQSRMEL